MLSPVARMKLHAMQKAQFEVERYGFIDAQKCVEYAEYFDREASFS